MKYQALFFSKIEKMLQNLSSAAVVIGVLILNICLFLSTRDITGMEQFCEKTINFVIFHRTRYKLFKSDV